MSNRRLTLIIAMTVAVVQTGCGIQRVFYRPSTSAQVLSMYDVVLAGEFGSMQQPPPSEGAPPATDDRTPPDEDEPASDERDAAGDKPVVPYTTPGSRGQALTLIALTVAAFGTGEVGGSGREAAESSMSGFEAAVGGRPGLTAPATRMSIAGGRPGLQQGFADALGFASQDRNIFTVISNPLSGPTGRCGELATAGFFADRAACETQFRR